jgi:hypothetical protein
VSIGTRRVVLIGNTRSNEWRFYKSHFSVCKDTLDIPFAVLNMTQIYTPYNCLHFLSGVVDSP